MASTNASTVASGAAHPARPRPAAHIDEPSSEGGAVVVVVVLGAATVGTAPPGGVGVGIHLDAAEHVPVVQVSPSPHSPTTTSWIIRPVGMRSRQKRVGTQLQPGPPHSASLVQVWLHGTHSEGQLP